MLLCIEIWTGNKLLEFVLLLLMIMPFAAFGVFYATYNRIVALDQRCDQAFHDIDIQLRHRHELIPNLVAVVRGIVDHESELVKAVVDGRMKALGAAAGPAQMRAEAELGQQVGQLLGMVEDYPDLKASSHFATLAAELTDCQHKIAAARRFNNLTTREYNTVVNQFPGRKVAPMFRLNLRKFLDMTPERVYFEDTPVVKF